MNISGRFWALLKFQDVFNGFGAYSDFGLNILDVFGHNQTILCKIAQ